MAEPTSYKQYLTAVLIFRLTNLVPQGDEYQLVYSQRLYLERAKNAVFDVIKMEEEGSI